MIQNNAKNCSSEHTHWSLECSVTATFLFPVLHRDEGKDSHDHRAPLSLPLSPGHPWLFSRCYNSVLFAILSVSGPCRPTPCVASAPSQICISLEEEKQGCLLLSRHKYGSKFERDTEFLPLLVNVWGILFEAAIDPPLISDIEGQHHWVLAVCQALCWTLCTYFILTTIPYKK